MLLRRFDFTLHGTVEEVGMRTGATIHTEGWGGEGRGEGRGEGGKEGVITAGLKLRLVEKI
jgi:hypothetical protein